MNYWTSNYAPSSTKTYVMNTTTIADSSFDRQAKLREAHALLFHFFFSCHFTSPLLLGRTNTHWSIIFFGYLHPENNFILYFGHTNAINFPITERGLCSGPNDQYKYIYIYTNQYMHLFFYHVVNPTLMNQKIIMKESFPMFVHANFLIINSF